MKMKMKIKIKMLFMEAVSKCVLTIKILLTVAT